MHFWSIAGLMVLATTAILVVPLFWRASVAADSRAALLRRAWPAFVLAAAVPLAALGVYAMTGSPRSAAMNTAPPVGDVAAMHARTATQGGQAGGSLEQAVERLRARLAADPRDVNGWRLLAQSYEYLGRTSDAAEANRHAEVAANNPDNTAFAPAAFAAVTGVNPPAGASVATPAAASASPAVSNDLTLRAQEHRRRREFHAANLAFAELAKSGAMNADLWADYADSLGGEHGSLDARAADCIAAALRLDPDHPKALWLQGSWQTQRNDYAAALATWQKLARVLPADSPDARFIAENIEEARAKSRGAAVPPAQGPKQAVAVGGTVQLDPRWRSRVPPDATLFVFARAADERGPPLAVLRTTAGSMPLKFTLDDGNAMMPNRKLSDFTRVILEARISRSGNAIAQPGDLHAVTAILDPRKTAAVQLNIADEIGPTTARGD